MTDALTAVLLFGGRPAPRRLRDLPATVVGSDSGAAAAIDAVTESARRVIVVGSTAELAAVLTRLLKTERLDVEVAHLPGRFGVRRARRGVAQRIPLIRDETGTALVGEARWVPTADADALEGEGIVDDGVLFDGTVQEVRIEPIATMPGLRARVVAPKTSRTGWLVGRAAQLGTTGASVLRDGVPMPRPVRRSTFYRHTQGWLRVR
ncbi:peptidase M50 [[Mycobacterium] wendilense]|uniref:Peptidase M50 n=1 Tax=[Mycobacterium] wendilense TaxID=3064284 RepID=A0ABN9P2X7_9MYCO|nr:peptidase M50 [Mycolicibacterium sp. MU0050]CAJ1585867.1 peptidase M50 [Mycolicibacterium sp. MU0050]